MLDGAGLGGGAECTVGVDAVTVAVGGDDCHLPHPGPPARRIGGWVAQAAGPAGFGGDPSLGERVGALLDEFGPSA